MLGTCTVFPAGRAAASPVLLQISDIHTSQHQHVTSHRERHEEFQLFSALVAPRIKAAAVVLTGDLVDSKSVNAVSAYQSEWEWQTYRNVTDVLLGSLEPCLQVCSIHNSSSPSFCRPSCLKGGTSSNSLIHDTRMFSTCISVFGSQVLADVRGNHDNYNVPLRGAPGDYYTAYGRTKELVSARATVKDVLKDDGAP